MTVQGFEFTPVVIIGAGRSGTNALRDMLTRLPQFSTWPCDEINPIWRHGNLDHPDDEFPVSKATPAVKSYIRNAFRRIWSQQGRPDFVVEKTCANSLRVPFVAAVLPEARFLYIVRDGVDVVASAGKRWQGELELPGLPYFLAKARFAPLTDLPRYGWSFLKARWHMLTGKSEHLGSWGPKFAGMTDVAAAPLPELVARQWAACVTRSDAAFQGMDTGRVLNIRYEDFVSNPEETLREILGFLATQATEVEIEAAISGVRSSSVGKGREDAQHMSSAIQKLLADPMQAHGYRM